MNKSENDSAGTAPVSAAQSGADVRAAGGDICAVADAAVDPETEKAGFISEEQYEEAVKAVNGDDGDYAAGGELGCVLEGGPASDRTYRSYTGYRRGGDYPPEVSLVPLMPPVFRQSGRGTCAAMTITALAEYYEGCRVKLSPQYLYCKCKEFEYGSFRAEVERLLESGAAEDPAARLDGVFKTFRENGASEPKIDEMRRDVLSALGKSGGAESRETVCAMLTENYMLLDKGGTPLDIAMRCLDEDGICEYDVWPYQPSPIPGNEGQFVDYPEVCAPKDAEKNARRHRLRDDFKMICPPNCVDAYKAVLSGAGGNRPMPIAIGVRAFASWTNSPFAKKTGWISMPLHFDRETGGHAMLVVGYKDSPKVPGGGYFIVRNSWGREWAFGAPDPGYARMPYKYAETFVEEAATIIQKREDAPATADAAETGSAIDKYLGVASEDMRDGKGIWSIARGSRIITDPETGISEPDTESNRAAFVRNGFSWRKPEAERTSEKAPLDAAADSAVGVMKNFVSNLDANLRNLSPTYCFPNINMPLSARLLPWQIRVKKVGLLDDLSRQWVAAQIADGLLDAGDEELALLCNSFRLYELRNGGVKFVVAAIFVSAIVGGKVAERIDNRFSVCAEKLLGEYRRERCRFSPAAVTFCVFGTSGVFSEHIRAGMSHDTVDIIAQKPGERSPWEIRFPAVTASLVWYNFIEHLSPMSDEEKREYVQSAIARLERTTLGHITLEKIAEETKWPLPLVLIEVDRLCCLGGYKYKNKAVIVDKNIAPGHGALGFKRALVFGYYNNFVSTICFSIGSKLLINSKMDNTYQISTIAGLALFSYIGSLLSADSLRKVVGIKKG